MAEETTRFNFRLEARVLFLFIENLLRSKIAALPRSLGVNRPMCGKVSRFPDLRTDYSGDNFAGRRSFIKPFAAKAGEENGVVCCFDFPLPPTVRDVSWQRRVDSQFGRGRSSNSG
jgi:hypothetical protein